MTYCISCPEEGYIPQQNVKIYVEDHFYPKVNAFIRENYDKIQESLSEAGDGLLLYLPMLWEETPDELIEYITGHHADQLNPLITTEALQRIWPSEVIRQIKGSGSLQYTMGFESGKWMRGLKFTPWADQDIPNETLLRWAGVEEWNEEGINVQQEEPNIKDIVFDATLWEEDDLTMKHVADAIEEGHITDEQMQKLNLLVEHSRCLISAGLSIQMIRVLAQAENELSTVEITDDFRIILPGLNNMEIPLKPLQTAMYIVFRNHPEGVSKTDMEQLSEDIYSIYKKTSDKWNGFKLKNNVRAWSDTNTTTFEDKCHAMRRQFYARLDETVARHYLPLIKG